MIPSSSSRIAGEMIKRTLTGRVGLVDGHEPGTMNGAASVYTSSKVKGTSKGDGKGLSLSDARIYAE